MPAAALLLPWFFTQWCLLLHYYFHDSSPSDACCCIITSMILHPVMPAAALLLPWFFTQWCLLLHYYFHDSSPSDNYCCIITSMILHLVMTTAALLLPWFFTQWCLLLHYYFHDSSASDACRHEPWSALLQRFFDAWDEISYFTILRPVTRADWKPGFILLRPGILLWRFFNQWRVQMTELGLFSCHITPTIPPPVTLGAAIGGFFCLFVFRRRFFSLRGC